MSRMKISDFKKLEFYQIPKWLLKVKKLKPTDILIYMLAYNNWKLSQKNNLVNEDEEIYFFMTHEAIKEELEVGKDQVIDSIKRLVESKVIIQEKFIGKATRYYLENDLSKIEMKDKNNIKTSRKKSTTENPSSVVVKSDYPSTEKPTTYQSENKDINKTNVLNKTDLSKKDLNKTTTKQDNINYIKPISNEIEKSGSSLNSKIKEIKTYLHEEIKDITTCKNIMFLVENRNLSLEKIKEVVNHANKYQKGSGFIYKALEQNWTLAKEDKVLKPGETVRGSKVNHEAIESNILAEKEKEVALELRENLNDFFNKLPEKERIDIENKAYEIALEQYGHATAKVMARTKTKYEILKQYHSVERGA